MDPGDRDWSVDDDCTLKSRYEYVYITIATMRKYPSYIKTVSYILVIYILKPSCTEFVQHEKT